MGLPSISPRILRNIIRALVAGVALGVVVFCTCFFIQWPTHVPATTETDPVPHASDAADDPCIWVHPTDPALSLVIGADKDGGIGVYDLNGKELQFLRSGRINNIDLRYNFDLNEDRIPFIVGTNRSSQAVDCYTINPKTRKIKQIGSFGLDVEPYGCCMYFSTKEQAYYCFVTARNGVVEQWLLGSNRIGDVTAKRIRRLELKGKIEGCVADDELGFLYVSEEKKGIWKFWADPGINDEWREQICETSEFGELQADVEGLTIYYRAGGKGYLIASSQGNDRFAVFKREGKNEYITSFAIGGGGIDRVTRTDGIDVTNMPLGPRFPDGLFVAQDDVNNGANQNFKLVRWGDIVMRLDNVLVKDLTWDPRKIGKRAE